MKKHLLLFCMLLCSISGMAYDAVIDGIYYNLNESEKTAEVTYYSKDSNSSVYSKRNVTIPDSITYSDDTYAVTSIGEYAFNNCDCLIFITIPETVTSIGAYAYQGCNHLSSITIPKSVTSIGEMAFHECHQLTKIVVEEGNTIYDSRNHCNAIIKTASNMLIAGCKSTKIPEDVTAIGEGAFIDCSGLASVIIPNSVISIGNNAFSGSGLTSITIPNSVISIGDMAFSDCSNLTSIVVEEGNTKYDSRDHCNAIIETTSNMLIAGCKNTIIPENVDCIGKTAFKGCTGLTSIDIPKSITYIYNHAFYGCI